MRIPSLKEALTVPWQRTLFIMFFAQLMTAVGFSSIFPFLPLYVEELGSTTHLSIELLAGLVFSAQAFTMMIASPFWGVIADRYGRKLMVERSMFGGAVILLLMTFVQSGEQLVVLRTIQGFITGTLAASNALVASVVPRQRTGYAMGLLQVGLGTGVALGPLIGGALADTFGYGAAFYVTAVLLFLAGVTVMLGVHEEFIPAQAKGVPATDFLGKWRRLITTPGVMITYGMRFMSQLGRMMIIPILPLFVATLLSEQGRVNTFTGLVIGAGSAMTTISAIYLGRLGDNIGHRRIVIASVFATGVLYFPHAFVQEGWQILVLFGLVGIGMGGVIPGVSALLSAYTVPGEEGSVFGLDNSIRAAARTIAPLVGSVIALWFGLRGTFVAAAGILFVAGLIAAWRLPRDVVASMERPVRTQTQHW